jgi:hypothetical protein
MWAKRSASSQAAIDGQATVSEYVQSRPCEDEESCRESGGKRILQGHSLVRTDLTLGTTLRGAQLNSMLTMCRYLG